VTTGSVTTGSVTTGSVTTGSVTTGSVTTGSVTTGSVTTGSVTTTGFLGGFTLAANAELTGITLNNTNNVTKKTDIFFMMVFLSVAGCHFTGPLALRPNFSVGLPLSLNNDELEIKDLQIKNFPFGNWLPFYRPSSFASLLFSRFAFIVGK
jgi:predicted small lipoprotein YifL